MSEVTRKYVKEKLDEKNYTREGSKVENTYLGSSSQSDHKQDKKKARTINTEL